VSETRFESWAVVDLFGHDKIAGYVTEISMAGKGFFRVDVPPMNGEEGYSKIFGPDAIYSMLPVASKEVAMAACVSFAVRPLGTWTPSVLRALPPPTIDQDEVEDEDEELICKTCGESFADLGDPTCPFCGSDDTEPLD
jgi:hypothetical protein